MHVIFRERHGLEETEAPTDLAQSPADLVVLSFSDSDLGAFAAGWHRACEATANGLPTLRLANLAALKHPLSVDTYVEQTLTHAKGLLIRLIGGEMYWSYGLTQVASLAKRNGIALAVLPADGRPDPRLESLSTVPTSTYERLQHYCDAGGAVAAQAALVQLALAAGLYAAPVHGPKPVPSVGAWSPEHGVCCPFLMKLLEPEKPLALLVFYRAYLTAADLAPVEALWQALQAHGFACAALFAPSLKAPDATGWLARQVRTLSPAAIVNLTAFSGKGKNGTSPLDAADAPVFQVALATSDEQAWAEAERGLSPADLAMHVVLPEMDGRLFAGVASFKQIDERDEALEFQCVAHRPQPERIAAIAERVAAWHRLAASPPAKRRLALVLSTYPGKPWQMAHAVGLDTFASVEAILCDLAEAGFVTPLPTRSLPEALSEERIAWPLAEYETALANLSPGPDLFPCSRAGENPCLKAKSQNSDSVGAPQTWAPANTEVEGAVGGSGYSASLRARLLTAWGPPEHDPDFHAGAFHFRAVRSGNALIALQPERGEPGNRYADYHDLSRVPRHAYIAFYLWLRKHERADVLIHIGAHGTLEWLPGKAVALSGNCWPEALTGPLPVLYPFIVNDPGEAAQAKRRIGAVTLGHLPPPLSPSGTPERLARLEYLLDEFSNADGLDPKRRTRLQAAIRIEAAAQGVEQELGLDAVTGLAEALNRIDRFVCDVKDSQFTDGLHVWGRSREQPASADAERRSLARALDGRRIAPGPAGSPYRGRRDVLPTGRNLFSVDPRTVPTEAAYAQGVAIAEELIRRHLQDEGDWPRRLVVDLWGSATMRTAGEEFAMALHLLGAKPVWDAGSARVGGVEIVPLAELNRPRVDVTLRISGLFRDIFPSLPTLFGQVVRALAERFETQEWNPFVCGKANPRVYGPAPGHYGLALGETVETYTEEARKAAGEAWLAASAWAMDERCPRHDPTGIAARAAAADSFVHIQDLAETDLLLAADYAGHEAGFAAANALSGGKARLYHLDTTRPDTPRARTLAEEIARVIHARATHPSWIAGMRRHGFHGAAEIAATLDHLAGFAHLAGAVPDHLFDLYHEATLGDDAVVRFMETANPQALAAMQARFTALHRAGLWQTRRNSVAAMLEATE